MARRGTCVNDRGVALFWNDGVLAHTPLGWDPAQPSPMADQLGPLLSPLLPPGKAWIHPERPERLAGAVALLQQNPVSGACWHAGLPATDEDILRVHSRSHLDAMLALRGQYRLLDPDTTAVSPGSIDAALLAAGQAQEAMATVMNGSLRQAMALVRPPGHHAEHERARGFCFFNSVAVAAAWAMARTPGLRVLIVDWDAHHGNGTEQIFAGNPDVLFFDTHRASPFYPGSGHPDQQGCGNIINVPLPEAAGDTALALAFDHILIPAVERFRPDVVLVSAGYDADLRDLALGLTPGGFAALLQRLQGIADTYAGGRLVLVTEGGYNTEALAENVHTTVSAMCGCPVPQSGDDLTGLAEVEALVEFHAPRWR